jgi:homoserine trans-succinylase
VNIDIPVNYFPGNDIKRKPKNEWRGHKHLLFSNWLNHFVCQDTPYIEKIDENTIPFSYAHQSQLRKENKENNS